MLDRQRGVTTPIGTHNRKHDRADRDDFDDSSPPAPLQMLVRIALLVLVALCFGLGAERLVRMSSN